MRPTECVECGASIEQPTHGGIRVYCAPCVRLSANERARKRRGAKPRPAACVKCHHPICQPARGRRKFCAGCAHLSRLAAELAWRQENRDQRRKRVTALRRANGCKPLSDSLAIRRQRILALAPQIEALTAVGMTYEDAGERLGITRNAIAGLLHRARKLQASGATNAP